MYVMDGNDQQQQRQARGLKASAVKPPCHHNRSDHSSESTSETDDHQIQKRNQPEESNIIKGPGTPGLGLGSERPSEHIVILPKESMQNELASEEDLDMDFRKTRISMIDPYMKKSPKEGLVTSAPLDMLMEEQRQQNDRKSRRDACMKMSTLRELVTFDMRMEERRLQNDLMSRTDTYMKKSPKEELVTSAQLVMPLGPRGHTLSAKEHKNNKDMDLLRAACSKKGDDWRKILEENSVLEQKNPLGNTLLHVAASYDNIEAAECLTKEAPNLLGAENSNGDTPLHVAARAGNISILQKLLATYFHQRPAFGPNFLSLEVYEDMKSMASSKNKQGNTFLHEALKSSKGMILQVLEAPLAMNNEENSLRTLEANFKTVVKEVASSITNNEDKSVLYLAIEAGYEDVVNGLLDHNPPPPIFGKSTFLGQS